MKSDHTTRIGLIASLVVLSFATGCQSESGTGTLVGAGIGAGVGAGVGALAGRGNGGAIAAGAAIGGALGGVSGYAVGKSAENDRKHAQSDLEFLNNSIALAEKDRAQFAAKNSQLEADTVALEKRRVELASMETPVNATAASQLQADTQRQSDAAEQEMVAIDGRIGYLNSARTQVSNPSDPKIAAQLTQLDGEIAKLSQQKELLQTQRNELTRIATAVASR